MFSHRNHATKAYVALGSNLGDRAGNLLLALRGMMEAAICVGRVSSVYETEPISDVEQPPFLNMVAEVGNPLPAPEQVMARLREMKGRLPVIGDVRGEGLLIGVEFIRDPVTRERYPADVNFGIRVREAARRRGLLLRASHWMLALAPPLTITAAEVDEMLDIIEGSLKDVLGAGTPDLTLVGGRVSA